MAPKRKRKHQPSRNGARSSKRLRLEDFATDESSIIKTRLLSFYYPYVQTLADYLLARCGAKSSFARRLAKLSDQDNVAKTLRTTLVGSFQSEKSKAHLFRARDFQEFTQRRTGSVVGSRRESGATPGSLREGATNFVDIVDFSIWLLFKRTYCHVERPPHILCNGFVRIEDGSNAYGKIPAAEGNYELSIHHANAQVERLKGDDWETILRTLGDGGDHIMLDLILDCGIFIPLEAGQDNYLQLSGINISDLPPRSSAKASLESKGQIPHSKLAKQSVPRTPSSISFVRNRMFYSRAALNAKGNVHFGIRHIHVLNRFPDAKDPKHTTHIMKYIFPRQFGLHNVFTSQVDKRVTAYPFQDYTLREKEIVGLSHRQRNQSLPKRLRGECFSLVQKLQIRHRRCAYKELLTHYCPVEGLDRPLQSRNGRKARKDASNVQPKASQGLGRSLNMDGKKNLVQLASPVADVSAFLRAVILNLIPFGFFGQGESGRNNLHQLLRSIDLFVRGKRFENVTLDSVYQGLKISSITWLHPPSLPGTQKLSKTDFSKRWELLNELLYYIFDSIVIPLIRANFHVTESSEHRYKLFFFRHDVWKLATEPAIAKLRSSMYQEIPQDKARRMLAKSPLGYSQVRLLPKKSSARPITNLKRRPVVQRGNRTFLGASINSTLKNVFGMLNYEKLNQPELLGSAIFSVDELYPRLRAFKGELAARGLSNISLYFVKVDVKSCFDTIPQEAIMSLVESICQRHSFTVKHHAQLKSISESKSTLASFGDRKPSRKFRAVAHAESSSQEAPFAQLVESQYATGKRASVFVEGAVQTRVEAEDLLDLLDDHVRRNVVRIGKKYFRQKNGIPQGSVVSSLLCSFFYGDFERRRLGFLASGKGESHSVLVRLIDDFLLVTTSEAHAQHFLQVMLAGDAHYGISIKPDKSLANFCAGGGGVQQRPSVPVTESSKFPWCGVCVDTTTLALTRDRGRMGVAATTTTTTRRRRAAGVPDLADATTVEAVRRPGAAFYRKTLAAVRLNVRHMFTDTGMARDKEGSANGAEEVRRELGAGMAEVAEKAARYLARLRRLAGGARGGGGGGGGKRQPEKDAGTAAGRRRRRQAITDAVLRRTIEDAAKLVVALAGDKRKSVGRRGVGGDRGSSSGGSDSNDMDNGGALGGHKNDNDKSRDGGTGNIDDYRCGVRGREMRLIVVEAFRRVLGRQQTGFRATLAWLAAWARALDDGRGQTRVTANRADGGKGKKRTRMSISRADRGKKTTMAAKGGR